MRIETKRLILREMTENDLPALRKILQDEEVMYAYEHAFSEEEVIKWFENQQRRYRENGFGLWAAVLKDGGEMIGQCGITYQDLGNECVPETGYLFQKKFCTAATPQRRHRRATDMRLTCSVWQRFIP